MADTTEEGEEWSFDYDDNSTDVEINENHLASTTVERAFGSLKNRFGIIKCDPYFPFETQVNIVLASCILHNWIISEGGDDFILPEDEWDMRAHNGGHDIRVLEESGQWLYKRDQIAQAMWHRMNEVGY